MIPDAAVEAAAREIFISEFYVGWDGLSDRGRESWQRRARAALEAAAPHIAGEAWERGYLTSHYLDRGYDLAKATTFPAPDHLQDQLSEWNPHK